MPSVQDARPLPQPTEEQSAALETLNGFRGLHGLKPVTLDRRLLAAAATHATAMAKKQELAHKESAKETSDAKKRAESYGYDGPVAELVAQGVPNAPYAVVSFMDAPYHRRLLLKPGALDFGCSVENGFACFVLGGNPASQVVLSPPPSSDGVPPVWDGLEEPNPMRGSGLRGPFGYPILVASYGAGQNLAFRSCSVVGPGGKAVECVVKHPGNDLESRDCVIIIPKAPLTAKSSYKVTAAFTVGGVDRSESWSFRTGSE